jgi:alanine racemase
MTGRVMVHLDAEALRNNASVVRRHAPGSRLVAVVKSDAYGHGVGFVSRHLAPLVDGFAVATVDEAVTLRALGVHGAIWVLSDFSPPRDMPRLLAHDLCPVLHHRSQLSAILDLAAPPREVVIKIDTGMGRLGFEPSELGELVDLLRRRPIPAIRVMTHFGNADDAGDDTTARQIRAFEAATRDLELEHSLANSAGILAWRESHAHWVRPGIMLYGVSPMAGTTGADYGLKPVMTVSTNLVSTRFFQRGQTVGYGATWRCRHDTRAAVLACGYGDGYPRNAPNGTPVLIAGEEAPVIGRVSMDSMAVDVTGVPTPDSEAKVILWGEGLPVERVAEHCGTIAYELFCRLAPRRPLREESNGCV